MPIAPELESFLAMFKESDRADLTRILETNEAGAERMKSGNNLYEAFVTGDPNAVQSVTRQTTQETTPPRTPQSALPNPTTQTSAVGVDEARLASIIESKLGEIFTGENFTKQVNSIFERKVSEVTPGLLGTTTKNADEIYTIRRASEKEFNKELDTVALTKFVDDARKTGKTYGSYVDAYNDFVNEDRVQARIAKGIKDGLVAKANSETPDSSLTRNNPLAPKFMREVTQSDSARGPALDQARKAFRTLQDSHVQ